MTANTNVADRLTRIETELTTIRGLLEGPRVAMLRELHALGETLARRARDRVSDSVSPGEQAQLIADAVYRDLRDRALALAPVLVVAFPALAPMLGGIAGGSEEGS